MNNIEDSLEIFTKNGAKKALKLSVSAPFHCPLMKPAKIVMEQTLNSTELYKPIVPVLSNVSVESESSTDGNKNNLINQVTRNG